MTTFRTADIIDKVIGMHVNVGHITNTKGASLFVQGKTGLGENLGAGFQAKAPAEIEITITNTGRFLHAEGRIEIHLTAECVRCLTPFDLRLAAPFTQDYLPAPPSVMKEEAANECARFTDGTLNLDPAVLETALLALPMKPLCRQDCPGLCAQCGRNLKEGECGCNPLTSNSRLAELTCLLPKKEV